VLAEFKAVYKALETGNPALDHLLLGLLKWLEERLINNRVKSEVNEAIEEVVLPPLPDMVTPIYSERPVETSERLPELRVTAPWYVPPDNDVKGALTGVTEGP
jgi:hypothetical protein